MSAADLSVVVCCHDPARWDLLTGALDSLSDPRHRIDDIRVVVDHCDELLDRLRDALDAGRWPSSVTATGSTGPKGLSGARNCGLYSTDADVVAFVDDDAVVFDGWADAVRDAFADDLVVGLGGVVDAVWEEERPRWFPPEFDWVVGCTHRGRPVEGVIRNPIGANMAFRTKVLRDLGGFSSAVGRNGASLMSCEETDLGIRAAAHGLVVASPDARAAQFVPASRARWSYFLRRCAAEGRSKAVVAARLGTRSATGDELGYSTKVLPAAVWRSVRRALTGRPAELGQAAAVVAGLAVTAAAFAVETVRVRIRKSMP